MHLACIDTALSHVEADLGCAEVAQGPAVFIGQSIHHSIKQRHGLRSLSAHRRNTKHTLRHLCSAVRAVSCGEKAADILLVEHGGRHWVLLHGHMLKLLLVGMVPKDS